MTWAKVVSFLTALASAVIVTAYAPAVLTDPLALAVAQIRVNAAVTQPASVILSPSEMTTSETSAPKGKFKSSSN